MIRQWIWPLSPAMLLGIAFVVLSRFVGRTPVLPRELSIDRSLTARAPAELMALSTAIDIQHWVLLVLGAVVALLLARRFRQALLVLLAEPLAEALSLALKVLVDRQLPNQAAQVGFTDLDGLLFPSGHVVRVTVTVGLLVAFVAWPHARVRWPSTLAALAFIALVAVTQITVGGHLPLDVVGAVLLGGVIVNVLYVVERVWMQHLSPPQAAPAVSAPRLRAIVHARLQRRRAWPAMAVALGLVVVLGTLRTPQGLAHLTTLPHPQSWAHTLVTAAVEPLGRTHALASRLREWATSSMT